MILVKKIKFSFKDMGTNAYIPIIVNLLIVIIVTLKNIRETIPLEKLIPLTEMVIPVFASWWSIFIVQSILEKAEGEVYFSYPTQRYKYGIFNVSVFAILYILCIFAIFAILEAVTGYRIFLSLFQLQIILQSLFYAFLGFFLICLFGKTELALLFIGAYLANIVFNNRQSFDIISIHLLNNFFPNKDDISQIIFKLIFIGIPCIILAQRILNRIVPSKKTL